MPPEIEVMREPMKEIQIPDDNLQIQLRTEEDHKEDEKEENLEEEEQAEVVKCPEKIIILEPEAQEVIKLTLANSGNVIWDQETSIV